MGIFFNYNGKLFNDGCAVINPNNRSFRYGDGVFETLKVIEGKIELSDYHFERLFSAIHLLKFDVPKYFTPESLCTEILELCRKNKHFVARVKLVVFRGNGGLYDQENNLPNYIIQTWSLKNDNLLNSNGLIIDVYSEAKKSCDKFSNVKSNNFLPYVMAALYAKTIKINDCILLNTNDRICDTTIANIFLVKNNIIYTPPLNEGCIAGVIRRFIIEHLHSNFKIIEKQLSINDVQQADEIFLTNSIKGIKWVKQFKDHSYKNIVIKQIHQLFLKTLY